MSDSRQPDAPIAPRTTPSTAGDMAHAARSVKWPRAARAREVVRRLLTRLQLSWLVHLASQPHGMSGKSAMIVAPHPDDEALGCGGLIALKRRDQTPVQIVFVTDGAASHGSAAGRGSELAALRRQEALHAAAVLGVEACDVHFLDKPDGGLRTLDAHERRATIEAMASLLAAMRPQELYVPHRHDRTDDHEATYELALAAVRFSGIRVEVFQYPIWLLWSSLLFRDFSSSDLEGPRRLRIHSVMNQKKRALEAHRSQWMPRGIDAGPVLEAGFVSRFCLPDEVYFQTAVPAGPDRH